VYLVRFGFYLMPAYRRTGGRVEYVSADLTSICIRLPCNRRTRNMAGSIFGGCLFGVTDGPHPMLLIMALGRDYVVWDKAAYIRYKQPARSTLRAEFVISTEEVNEVREILAQQDSVDCVYRVELKDSDGGVHAIIERTVYIANKAHYKQKISNSNSS
jgi:acyl-coenzyme A thioesterase PaaI-like protein